MTWNANILSQGELHALREAAERAWGNDTRHDAYQGHPNPSSGQCYVTSKWLVHRLGGHVGRVKGHYVWVSPGGEYAIDLTGDRFPLEPSKAVEGMRVDKEDTGLVHDPHQKIHRPCPILFKRTSHPLFKGLKTLKETPDDDRSRKFITRADREYESLGSVESKIALDYAGDAFPASQPQAVEDTENRYWHDEPGYEPGNQEFKFVYGNGNLEVSDRFSHEELAEHANLSPDHSGPMAVGYVTVNMSNAVWELSSSNVGAHALIRVLKDYTKHVGWKWGGATDQEGEPIGTGSEFASKTAVVVPFRFVDGELLVGTSATRPIDLVRHYLLTASADMLDESISGWFEVSDSVARLVRITLKQPLSRIETRRDLRTFLKSAVDWSKDDEIQLLSANDNVLKTIEDLDADNIYSPEFDQKDRQFFPPSQDQREPSGVYKCPNCSQIFPSWHTYIEHKKSEEPSPEQDEDGGFPEMDMDANPPTHFTEMQPQVQPVSSAKEAARVYGREIEGDHLVAYHYGCAVGALTSRDGKVIKFEALTQPAKRVLTSKWLRLAEDGVDAEVPFIFDVQEDAIFVGEPGTRTSQIPGRFTPGGIVEGTYEPSGKVLIRSLTNMPYTVRHMVELWYWQHPELVVKSVHLEDDEGKNTKLAAIHEFTTEDKSDWKFQSAIAPEVGIYLQTLAAADPAVKAATQALQAQGRVFVVGGAVRDAVSGKEPKDIDLMVQGVPPDDVKKALADLPGKLDLTGKDFGVFRYKQDGSEVEIALPRREQSTGETHKDFDVQTDHTMKPEQDLYRRDFTANAMAVDLATGEVLDPYGGADDIAANRLSTVHEHALSEDPLRIVRALVANARHGLEPDEGTRAQMAANAASIEHLPPERVQAELDKLMKSDDPAKAIELAHRTGVLNQILPEVDRAFGYDQNNPHHEMELGDHLMSVLRRTAELTDDPDIRMAALLHDIGKPDSAWVDPETGGNHYYEGPRGQGAYHELVGADQARNRLEELRYPNDRINRVTDLIRHHMWKAFTSPKGARKFLNRVGEHADDLVTLREADQGGKAYPNDPQQNLPDLDEQKDLLEGVRAGEQPTQRSQLAINGNDLIEVGIQPGPQIGQILNELTEKVIEDPELNTREKLVEMVQNYG